VNERERESREGEIARERERESMEVSGLCASLLCVCVQSFLMM
jgi:hypothetical protein